MSQLGQTCPLTLLSKEDTEGSVDSKCIENTSDSFRETCAGTWIRLSLIYSYWWHADHAMHTQSPYTCIYTYGYLCRQLEQGI